MKGHTIFSFSRFVNVMKYDLGSNWKGYLYSFLTITGIFLFCYLLAFVFLGGKIHLNTGADGTHSILLFVSGSMGVVTPFLFYIGAGRMLKVMRTKEGRESYLMLPATRQEKFVSRALLSTLGVFVLIVFGVIAADLLRFVFHPLFFLPESMTQLHFPTILSDMFRSPFSILDPEQVDKPAVLESFEWISLALVLWVHSLFILGGTAFVKHPVIKTFGCLFLLFFFLSNLVLSKGLVEQIESWSMDDGVLFTNVMTVIFFIIFVFNWWLSYYLFSRAQIIRKKFF